MTISVSDAVLGRYSCRAFLPDRAVPDDILKDILDTARQSPSGGNVQPWRTWVVSSGRLGKLQDAIHAEISADNRGGQNEYRIYPEKLGEPYRSRRFKCGEDLYAAIGIPRDDRPARLRQLARNYECFGAPTLLLFALGREMQPGQWSDMGMYLQTIMLLAHEQGLATCPQEAWAQWNDVVRAHIPIPDDFIFFAGISIGYEDKDSPINGWRTDRAPMDELVTFLD